MRERRRPRVRIKGLSINRLLPNILTTLALCAGLTGIRFAIQERWELAVISILIAAIFDGLDGRVARLLRSSSKFGAELDSLADFCSFGVSPAVILYLWMMQDAGTVGWLVVMIFAVCAALRLARFNTALGSADLPPFAYNYFTGVPTPAGAILVLMPVIIGFQIGTELIPRAAVAVWILIVAFLLVSPIPTYAMKGARIPQQWIGPMLLGLATIGAALATAPWETMTLLCIVYLALIPVSARQYRHLALKAEALRLEQEALADGTLMRIDRGGGTPPS